MDVDPQTGAPTPVLSIPGGSNPYFLLIVTDEKMTQIDLDASGWATTHADLMRHAGTWHLIRKDGQVMFSLAVYDGEQPYYTARHMGTVGMAGGGHEIIAYGIGKKRLDGHVDRLWVMPNGQICGGDDVESFARAMLAERG